MDRSWMSENRASLAYVNGVKLFIKVAKKDMKRRKQKIIVCPCQTCANGICFKRTKVIEEHLITTGFMEGYTCWTKHGETPVMEDVNVNNTDMPNPDVDQIHQDCEMPDQGTVDSEMPDLNIDDDDFPMPDLHQMIKDFEGKDVTADYSAFPALIEDSNTPLYEGCKKNILS